jgi:DNA-directed RNA polymerase specialized sigma24 family protein
MAKKKHLPEDFLDLWGADNERELLERWRKEEELSRKQIEDRIPYSSTWVGTRLRKYDLDKTADPKRALINGDIEAAAKMLQENREDDGPEIETLNGRPGPEDVEEVKRLYWVEGYSQNALANGCDCSQQTIRKYMRRHDIPVRSPGEKVTCNSVSEVPDSREADDA